MGNFLYVPENATLQHGKIKIKIGNCSGSQDGR